jgi:hypothetical protein
MVWAVKFHACARGSVASQGQSRPVKASSGGNGQTRLVVQTQD